MNCNNENLLLLKVIVKSLIATSRQYLCLMPMMHAHASVLKHQMTAAALRMSANCHLSQTEAHRILSAIKFFYINSSYVL